MTDLNTNPAQDDVSPAAKAAETDYDPDAALETQTDETEDDLWSELQARREGVDAKASVDDDLEDKDDPQDQDGDVDTADTSAQKQTEETDPAVLKAERDRKAAEGRHRKSQRELKALQAKLDRLTTKAPPETNRDAEKLQAAADEYPDVVGPVLEHVAEMEERLNSLTARDADEVKDIQNAISDITAEQTETLFERHPDYNDVLKNHGPVYRDWIKDQPKWLRDIHTANYESVVDGEGVANVIDKFKEALRVAHPDTNPAPVGDKPNPPKTSARRKAQMEGAVASRSRGPAVTTDAHVDSEDMDALWNERQKKVERERKR